MSGNRPHLILINQKRKGRKLNKLSARYGYQYPKEVLLQVK